MSHTATHGHADSARERRKQERAVLELKEQGLPFDEIAQQLGMSRATAQRRYHAAIDRIPAAAADQYRAQQLARIELARAVVMDILAAKHVTISEGRIIKQKGPDGEMQPLEDDGPTLAAVDRLIRLEDVQAKLCGTYQPAKVEQSGSVTFRVAGVDLDKLV